LTFRQVLFIAEELDISSDEAVCDAPSTVDVGSFHDSAVLHLGVTDYRVVSDTGVGADVGVGADDAVAADDGGPLMVVRLWMMVPSPMPTLLVIVAESSTVPLL